jgi:acetylornithine deacetylase/succinyl-diaminopimelate desuccinylase-like protein
MSTQAKRAEFADVEAHIDKNFEVHLAATQRFLQQPSISLVPPGVDGGVRKCAAMLRDILKDLGSERAEVVEFDQGYPVVFGKLRSKNPKAKTIIAYSLYDVMPVDDEDWASPPFAADILESTAIGLPAFYGKCIVARGARNQKGPIMGFVNALQSMLAVRGDIPVNVIFTFDGEEEIGSTNINGPFRTKFMDELRQADAAYYLNPSQNAAGEQLLYLGNRGIAFGEISIRGGDWGGPAKRPLFAPHDLWVDSPAWRLVQALATMKDQDGNVLVEGFYDNIRPVSAEDRRLLDELKANFDEEQAKRELDIVKFKRGKSGRELLERYVMRPNINIDGYSCGYTGAFVKTMFPDRAVAKIDIRLVPDQTMDDLLPKLRKHFDRHGFPEVEVNVQGFYNPSKTEFSSSIVQAAIRAAASHDVKTVCWPLYYAGIPMAIFNAPPLNLPAIGCGLGRMGREHIANEYFTVEGLRLYEKFVVAFLHEFARG